MPTYQYECSRCGYSFERFQKITDPPAKRCPKCRCGVKRVPASGAGIIFKGSGFYQTDYRSDSYKNAATKESGGGKKTDKTESKSTSTSSETKPKAEPVDKKKSA